MEKARGIFTKASSIWAGLGIAIVGALFAAAGIFFLMQPKGEYIETTATVLEVTSYYSAEEHMEYYGVIEYQDASGTTYRNDSYPVSSDTKAGDTLTIEYDSLNPENIQSEGGEYVPYIFVVLGIVIFVFGLYKLIQAIKKPAAENNELNQVDMSGVTKEQTQEIAESAEYQTTYYFHFTQELKQGYVLETTARQLVYEAKCEKLGVISKSQFLFKNHLTGQQSEKEISHTVSDSIGSNQISYLTKSSFKIDGVECWKVLGDMGYSLEPVIEKFHVDFKVMKYGVQVATMKAEGTNVATGKDYKWGNIPTKGIYSVQCATSDIEGVFMACFILARVE